MSTRAMAAAAAAVLPGEPMSMAVLPDRSVLHTARNGVLRRTTAAGVTNVIGTLQVYTHDEEGLQGVGVHAQHVQPGDRGGSANGTQLIIWSCHGGTNQRWTLP